MADISRANGVFGRVAVRRPASTRPPASHKGTTGTDTSTTGGGGGGRHRRPVHVIGARHTTQQRAAAPDGHNTLT